MAQHKLLVRLVTRLISQRTPELEAILLNFIIEDQKSRTDLALLWLAELYAQFMGFVFNQFVLKLNINFYFELSNKYYKQWKNKQFLPINFSFILPGINRSPEERMERYDTCLCNFLSILYERGEYKETYELFLHLNLFVSNF